MILTFYIQGRSEGAAPLAEFGDYEAFVNSMREKLARIPDVTLNQAVVWVMDQAEYAWQRTKRTLKYLSGAPVPAPPLPDTLEQVKRIEKPVENNGWKATGIFSSLKGSRGSSNSFLKADNRMFTEGEVHADLIRVSIVCPFLNANVLRMARIAMDTLCSVTFSLIFQVSPCPC